MSQFISNSSLFIQQTLKFESKLINNEQIQVPISDAKFGILNLIANTITLSQEEFEFVFEVDCSGSMSDKCQDGRQLLQNSGPFFFSSIYTIFLIGIKLEYTLPRWFNILPCCPQI